MENGWWSYTVPTLREAHQQSESPALPATRQKEKT